MESYRLVLEKGPRDAEWLLSWDDQALTLDAPDGQRVLEAPVATAHRLVEHYELDAEGKIAFATPDGTLVFRKHPEAQASVERLVEAGLAGDSEMLADMRRHSLWAIPAGLVIFAVAGGLFGLYCWYASWAPDPPAGHWMHWLKWPIHAVLLVVLAAALAGPGMAYHGLRQLLQVRRIERASRSRATARGS